MSGYVFAVCVSITLVAFVFVLLRTRRLREKYAAIWILLALGVVVVAIFPGLAFWLADLVGVATPVNLVFAVGFVVLLAVVIQLSTEVSTLEEETRTLAEEIGLLRLEVRTIAEPVPEARGPAAEPDAHRETSEPDDS